MKRRVVCYIEKSETLEGFNRKHGESKLCFRGRLTNVLYATCHIGNIVGSGSSLYQMNPISAIYLTARRQRAETFGRGQ